VFDQQFATHWDTPVWMSSPWNFQQALARPAGLIAGEIYDVTLRDGTQSANLDWNSRDRLKLAAWMAEAGVQRIEAGRAWNSQEDLQSVRAVVKLKTGKPIYALAEMDPAAVDLAADCGVDGVTIVLPSAARMIAKWGKTLDQIIEIGVEMMARAKRHGLRTTLFLTYGSQADPSDYRKLVEGIQREYSFDALALVDTLGLLAPFAVPGILAFLRELTTARLEVHFHNDYGVATANAMMALMHGVSVVHTTLGGVGERAGNAAFEEVVAGARILLNIDMGIPLKRLGEVPALMRQHAGFERAPNCPINGSNLYNIKLELIQRGYFTEQGTQAYHYGFPLHWQVIGMPEPEPVFSQDVSDYGVRLAMTRLGIAEKSVDLATLRSAMQRAARRRKRPLSLAEVARLIPPSPNSKAPLPKHSNGTRIR
jgi:isopropylmalate/homocitrate/citramalate synthase